MARAWRFQVWLDKGGFLEERQRDAGGINWGVPSMRLKKFILKQYGYLRVGAVYDTYSKTIGVIGLINALFIIPTGWEVWAKDFVQQYFPWMTFWLFASFGTIALLMGMIFIFKILVPSSAQYGNYMRAKHKDITRRDIANIEIQNLAILAFNMGEIDRVELDCILNAYMVRSLY